MDLDSAMTKNKGPKRNHAIKKVAGSPRAVIRRPLVESAIRPGRVVAAPSTRRLISGPENSTVEFKLNADAVTQDDLVAFANAGGGTILVGVDEATGPHGTQVGKIVGCDASDRERSKIASRARDCRPPVPVAISPELHGKRAIMRIIVQPGGLHCTAGGTYKIRADAQNSIIDPTDMVKIIVKLERRRILPYVKRALEDQRDEAQAMAEDAAEDVRSEIDDLRAEMESDHSDEEHDYPASHHEPHEW